MEIAFRTKSLRGLCESEESLRSSLGSNSAEALMACLADIAAARTPLDLPADVFSIPPRPSSREFVILLKDGVEAVFVANHTRVPARGIEWALVSRVKFMGTRRADNG